MTVHLLNGIFTVFVSFFYFVSVYIKIYVESVTRLKGANVLDSMVCIKVYTVPKYTLWEKKIHYLWTYFLGTLNVYGNIL